MKIILRNNTVRKDAAYILEQDDDGNIFAYWGKWSTYQTRGQSALRSQRKTSNIFWSLLKTKKRKGYFVIMAEDFPAHLTHKVRKLFGNSVSFAYLPAKSTEALKTPIVWSEATKAAAKEFNTFLDAPAKAEKTEQPVSPTAQPTAKKTKRPSRSSFLEL